MPNNNLWLRKIAAFLHDPPYKVWLFGKDYHGQRWKRDKDVIEIYENNIASVYPFKDPNNSNKIKFRKFHHVAASAGKNHYFGIKGPNIIFNSGGYRFIHPLSGETLVLSRFWDHVPDSSFDPKAEVEAFLNQLTGDERQKFLKLWRVLPSKIAVWINLLPIDTVLADNTTRDLDVIQSALVTTWEESISLDRPESLKPSFLILEFGPVQGFIENARKTRDLWFGSWLISYLSWQAMKPIAEKLGPDNIVYPDLYKQPLVDQWLEKEKVISSNDWDKDKLRLPTLPNTFLAIVKEGEEKNYNQDVIQGLENAWKNLVKDVREFLLQDDLIEQDSPLDEKFNEQTRKFPFDIYWLGVKWGDDPEKAVKDYKSLFKPDTCWEFGRLWDKVKELKVKPNIGDTYSLLVEMTQTGLKSLKYRGRPQAVEEAWEKCTLCGERSALVDIDLEKLEQEQSYVDELIEKFKYDNLKGIGDLRKKRNKLYRRRLKEFWKKMSDAFPGHIKENEHLCAVCLVKRLAPKVIWNTPEKFFQNIKVNSPDYKFNYHFPSTGSIALAPFIKRLIEKQVDFSPIEKAIEDLLKDKSEKEKRKTKNFLDAHFTEGRTVPRIKNRLIPEHIAGEKFEGDFETEWFYDESFPRFYEELKSQGDDDKIDLAKGIEEAVTRIKNEAKDKLQDKYHLPKYYAAVNLDGDDLGKWLRGDKAPKIQDVFHPDFVKAIYERNKTPKDLKNIEHFESIKDLKRPVTPAIHRAISGALRDFALEVVPYVVEHNLGVVVYSGGDDTLFLIPLENLLKTLTALRKLYAGEQFVGEFGDRKFVSEKGFIEIYEKSGENWNLKEIIRAMGTKATLSAGIAIAHYLDPLDITLKNARGMLKEAKTYEGKDRAGFKVIMHSGSERKAIVPWKFVGVMERFKQKVSSGMSTRFLRTLYEKIDVYDEIPEAFDAEFIKFGLRGSGNASKDILCELKDARSEAKLTPSEFLNALLIGDFLAREEGRK